MYVKDNRTLSPRFRALTPASSDPFSDEEIDPVILSVGEDEEISIKDVATAIAKHIGYSGGLEVRLPPQQKSVDLCC